MKLIGATSDANGRQIEMMKGMVEKGETGKHGEQVKFAACQKFCDDTGVDKKRAIEEANRNNQIQVSTGNAMERTPIWPR